MVDCWQQGINRYGWIICQNRINRMRIFGPIVLMLHTRALYRLGKIRQEVFLRVNFSIRKIIWKDSRRCLKSLHYISLKLATLRVSISWPVISWLLVLTMKMLLKCWLGWPFMKNWWQLAYTRINFHWIDFIVLCFGSCWRKDSIVLRSR